MMSFREKRRVQSFDKTAALSGATMRALLACLLTLTSIFGMLSKPIRDWIPEFPALHRWIIPVERPRRLNYIERETA